MKIIKAGYQVIDEPSITKKIERIARICYKSEDKIGEGTDIKMINKLIEYQHTAMLEHGDFAIIVDEITYNSIFTLVTNIETTIWADMESDNKRCHLRFTDYKKDAMTSQRFVVSGNVRAWLEVMDKGCIAGGWILPEPLYNALVSGFPLFENRYSHDSYDGKEYYGCKCELVTDYTILSNAERMVHETFSVLFTVDRGVTHEMVRHREECSFAQESTRYCNYNLGKFGNEITFIEPCFYAERDDEYNAWVSAMEDAEKHYFDLINIGSKPQEARDVLPNSTKADIVMTATLREWKHIFNLRACDSTGPAHPQIKEVMVPLLKDMKTPYPFAYATMITAG